jgi:peptidoglycan hydrolase-like protein with peptidoglycan-binding domain
LIAIVSAISREAANTLLRKLTMTLSWVVWRADARIQRAETSSPSMKPGESGQAVHLLQAALILQGFDVPAHGILPGQEVQNNNYGQQTSAAVRACEARFGLTLDAGIAGRQVISRLDVNNMLLYTVNAGQFGAELARTDVPLAVGKIASALLALNLLRAGGLPPTVGPMVDDALLTHFRLLQPGAAAIGNRRARTTADLDRIISKFTAIAGVLNNSATTFEDGIPTNGVKTLAESRTGSNLIRFGPHYFGAAAPSPPPLGTATGPHSRAAILLHEGTHAVDPTGQSGARAVHISEFAPGYAVQSTDLSLLNPSSFASFAAHIANNGDPTPRFGLGAGRNR